LWPCEVWPCAIDNKPGVQGIKAKWSKEKYGDWEIREMPFILNVEEKERMDNDILRQQALKKLTIEERKILGLK
jgi:hypothetical protein